jgi:glucosylceramidase
MLLDENGGPNHAQNWCIAPVIVKKDYSELYFTPLYYVMTHFSKFIRPNAQRIGFKTTNTQLHTTAVKNVSGNIIVIIYNESKMANNIQLNIENQQFQFTISGEAIQTVEIINAKTT